MTSPEKRLFNEKTINQKQLREDKKSTSKKRNHFLNFSGGLLILLMMLCRFRISSLVIFVNVNIFKIPKLNFTNIDLQKFASFSDEAILRLLIYLR